MDSQTFTDINIDWDTYQTWEDVSVYTQTLIVDQRHHNADDANPGTTDAPLRTIQAAASIAEPGTRVIIHAGLYREMVQPANGGTGFSAMIRYEAAPGEHVEIRGSRELIVKWDRPLEFHKGYGRGEKSYAISRNTWLCQVPGEVIFDDYDVLELTNVTPEDEALMEWMEPVSKTHPYELRRVMLFQDGTRLQQVHHPGDTTRFPGSFWVNPDTRQLMLHPLKSINPNDAEFEIAVQPHLFCPAKVGLDYITITGLHFSHCANGFLRASTGAVTNRAGAYWLVENCSITQCNSSGLECGDRAYEYKDSRQIELKKSAPGKRVGVGVGHNIIRKNHISECGTAGIRCLHMLEGRVMENHIHHCGWQEAEYYYECAGIKILMNKHTLVAENHIHHVTGACGIWMDWDNEHSRVTQNRIEESNGFQGAIFIEASPTPNLIDHNVIEQYDGPGIFGGDSSNQIYKNNKVQCTGPGIVLKCHTDRDVAGGRVQCTNNHVIANEFNAGEAHVIEEDGNHVID